MKIHKQKFKKIFFYKKFVHFGKNTSIYYSRIIVVHVHEKVFPIKFTQHVTILQTLLNQEVSKND